MTEVRRAGQETARRIRIGALGLLVVIIFGLPHLLTPAVQPRGTVYTPFVPFGASALVWDETVLYAPQANYTARTLRPAYDAGIYEYRNRPTVVPTVPNYVLAPIQWFTGSTVGAFVVADFIFPVLAFFLAIAIARRLGASEAVATAAAVLMLIPAQAPRNSVTVVRDVLMGQWTMTQPLEYSRFLAPEFSFTLLLAGLLFLIGATKSRWQSVMAGVTGGLMFYTYLYCWTVWVTGCLLLLGWTVVAKGRVERNYVVVNVVTWLCGIPFWIGYLRFVRSGAYEAVTHRMSWTIGHVPEVETIATTVVCLMAIAVAGRLSRGNENAKVLIIFILGGVVAYNGQIILGRTFESFHFPNRFFQPTFALVGAACLGREAERRWPRRTERGAWLLVACVLALGAARQAGVSIHTASLHALDPGSESLFVWLRANGKPDEVVLTSDESLNYILPIYTTQFVYLPFCILTSAPDSELAERFLITLRLLGYNVEYMGRQVARSAFDTRRSHVSWSFHLFRKHWLEENDIIQLGERWGRVTFPQALSRYRVDYVIRSPRDPATRESLEANGLRRVGEGRFGEIYRVDNRSGARGKS